MLRRIGLLLSLVALGGCVSPQVVVNAQPEKPAAKAKADTAKFGEYVAVPGQVVPLHGQELPKPDAVTPFWPDRVAERAPTETLIQPQVYVPRKVETGRLASLPAESPIVAAVRAYLDGRTDVAATLLHGLEPANQKAVMTLLPAMATAGRADLTADASLLHKQIESAADAAAKVAPLEIRKACFVWQVTQFGVYKAVPEKHTFLPGSAGVLYLELKNAPCLATALPSGENGYVTRLECGLQLIGADGKPTGKAESFPYAEYTLSPVRDYFLKVEFAVPLQPGTYTLAIDVRDPASTRKTRHAVELQVGR